MCILQQMRRHIGSFENCGMSKVKGQIHTNVPSLSEEYALEEAGPQTRVRHTVTIEGALNPLGYLVRRRLHRSMRTQDAALMRYLTREVRGSSFTINCHRRRARKAQLTRKAAND